MSSRRIMQLNIPDGVIDFGAGQPGLDLLPRSLMAQAAAHRLQQNEAAQSLQYGAEAGDGYFLQALARFLSGGYQMPVEADDLFTTNGASQALDAICKYYTQPGDTIFIEEPTYFLALYIFRDYPLNIVSIPIDQDGLVIEALEEKLQTVSPAFLYTIPAFHNPAAVTLSAERRTALLRLSEKYGFLIVADEVYHLLHFGPPPPPPLLNEGQVGRVLSLGSFSKILAPGLRLGWIQARNHKLLAPFLQSGLVESGGGLNPFASGLVRSALELGLQADHLAWLKAVYGRRAGALSSALQQHLPPDFAFSRPGGGFFIWLHLPDHVDAQHLLKRARAYKVTFKPGPSFSSQGGLRHYARLCFALYETEQLVEGVERLAQAVRS